MPRFHETTVRCTDRWRNFPHVRTSAPQSMASGSVCSDADADAARERETFERSFAVRVRRAALEAKLPVASIAAVGRAVARVLALRSADWIQGARAVGASERPRSAIGLRAFARDADTVLLHGDIEECLEIDTEIRSDCRPGIELIETARNERCRRLGDSGTVGADDSEGLV